MTLCLTTLPDGRQIHCVNAYEVDFSVHEIFNDDLTAHGIELPADGVYLDVGANIGLFSLHLLDQCPGARVFAYEPMPEAFAALERNLSGKAEVFAMGLGAAPGELDFEYFPGITALSSCHGEASTALVNGMREILFGSSVNRKITDILDKTGASQQVAVSPEFADQLFATQKVRARIETLSQQIRQHQLSHIDLLKIDTEGAEKDVLAGLDEADWPLIRQLVVEVHLGLAETELMQKQLEARGFRTMIGHHPLANAVMPVFHIYAKRLV